jgi:hypothetical protein
MSVTILTSLTTWQTVRAQDAGIDRPTRLRGRVITGLLTADEPDRPAVAPPGEPRAGEPRTPRNPGTPG